MSPPDQWHHDMSCGMSGRHSIANHKTSRKTTTMRRKRLTWYRSASKTERRKDGSDVLPGCANDALETFHAKVGEYVNAFLNCGGGTVMFGVENDRQVSGCQIDEVFPPPPLPRSAS